MPDEKKVTSTSPKHAASLPTLQRMRQNAHPRTCHHMTDEMDFLTRHAFPQKAFIPNLVGGKKQLPDLIRQQAVRLFGH